MYGSEAQADVLKMAGFEVETREYFPFFTFWLLVPEACISFESPITDWLFLP